MANEDKFEVGDIVKVRDVNDHKHNLNPEWQDKEWCVVRFVDGQYACEAPTAAGPCVRRFVARDLILMRRSLPLATRETSGNPFVVPLRVGDVVVLASQVFTQQDGRVVFDVNLLRMTVSLVEIQPEGTYISCVWVAGGKVRYLTRLPRATLYRTDSYCKSPSTPET